MERILDCVPVVFAIAISCLTAMPAAAQPADPETESLPKVHVLATGGTIAGAGYQGVEERKAQDLTEAVPQLAKVARVTSSDPFTVPSSALTPQMIWDLSEEIDRRFAEDPELAGLVVTQGTDSLEEAAFLLDLLHDEERPVVVTGAMRLPVESSADGTRNLLNAVSLAGSPAARGLGVLVVMNEDVHGARAVRKTHSRELDAFESVDGAPLGYFDGPELFLLRTPTDRLVLHPDALEPRVDLISLAVGSDGHLVRAAVEAGAQGIVIDAFGRGNLPRPVVGAVVEALQKGVTVVLTTRTGSGRSYVWPQLREGGALAAEGLDALEARLFLMAALPITRDPEVLESWLAALSGKAGAVPRPEPVKPAEPVETDAP